jgi:hypothetical protein
MKKNHSYYFALLLMFSVSLSAQVNYKILENSYQTIRISFTFGDIKSMDVAADEVFFSRISMDGCMGSKNIGEPQLPVSVNMLEIPFFEDYVLNIYGKDVEIFDAKTLGVNHPIYPAQPSVSKSHEGPVEFVHHINTYQTDAFYALPLAKFEETGVKRNVNLGTLYVSPLQYNPVTQEIKVFKSVDVEILFKNTDFVKTQIIKDLHKTPLITPSKIINSKKSEKGEFINTPIKYLIVAHKMFRGVLDDFILWKKQKGFLVEVGYTDDENVGTTKASIASYIKSQYDSATVANPAPTFVLLVGDVAQIPASQTFDHPTDLFYFTLPDSHFPWCYYGRFSAQSISQLVPQVEKTLQYEQYNVPDPNYLNKVSLIAGYDDEYASLYSNGFVNYVAKYYANAEYGYSPAYTYLHPCVDKASQIRDEIGKGVGIANYSAHCTPNGWSSPSFNKTHIAAMSNLNKYGLMIGSCCASNRFSDPECFGEALLTADGKGAVGYIGASNLTYWDEDYYWAIGCRNENEITANPTYDPNRLGAYDRLFHTHGENFNNWMTTFGAMMVAGNEAVQASTSDYYKKYYWEVYHLMGDPSVMTWLTKPSPMPVTITNYIEENTNTLLAKVVPYAYCALTSNEGELLSAGFADENGDITLSFDSVYLENYRFAAWAQHYTQFMKTLPLRIADTWRATSIQVYPNPTTGELTIDNGQLTIDNVEIYDIYGRIVETWRAASLQNDGVVLDISHFSIGIYFLKIQTDKRMVMKKIIKN